MNEWESRWQSGQTGWDRGESPPVLPELIATGTLPRGRALVPGCGAGYDVLALAASDRSVLGLEIAPSAVARFEALREAAALGPARAEVALDDFFTFAPRGRFDLIWDYTFLCAIAPSRRREWAERVDALLAPEGELVTLIFPVTGARPTLEAPGEGPPYPLHPDHVRELLEPRFFPTVLEPVTVSHPERQGKEWLGRWRRRA